MSPLTRLCSVCGKDDFTYLFTPAHSPGPIVQCNHCGFVYVNPIQVTHSLILDGPVLSNHPKALLVSKNLEDIKGSWEESLINRYMEERHAKELNARELLTHISNIRQDKGKILDVGCFCGVFLNIARQAGWECYGIEPLLMPAIFARASFGLNVITDILREETFPANFFDVITVLQVMEHLVDPDREIKIYHRDLKPGGLLVIEVPNIDTFMVRLFGPRHRHFVQDHVSFFSMKTLTYLLNRLDFEIKLVYYPARVLSLRQILYWVDVYTHKAADYLKKRLPSSLQNRTVRLCFRDIVTVIGEKR